jgi:hypothetical protein
MWEMEESQHGGGVYLKSKAHHRLLAQQHDTLCTTLDQFTHKETWRLEPRLPPSISGPKLAALGVASVVGVALTVATPFAVLGAVEAIGWTATELGLVAGLSAEAVAGFGGGALLGAGIVGTTAAMVNDPTQESESLSPELKEDYNMTSSLRPISAWRNW